MSNIILYGFGGAQYQYRVLRYYVIYDPVTTVELRNIARTMQIINPSIEHVYMISNRHGLRRDFQESLKQNSIESCAVFKDAVEREGIRIF